MNRIFEFTDKLIDKLFKSEKINSFLKKIINREMFDYLFFGVLTTVVSLVSFWLFDKILGSKFALISNVFSWIISVAFAFVTNKFFVFHSNKTDGNTLLKEIVSFTGARLFSLGVEEAGLFIAQFLFHADKKVYFGSIGGMMIAKIVLQIIVVIMNYVFSKLFIFKDKKEKE
ncbi:MAG: GtrA family protein [Clostridia bacterium]|nr:GtrA family protein [Clostridia bacterium]